MEIPCEVRDEWARKLRAWMGDVVSEGTRARDAESIAEAFEITQAMPCRTPSEMPATFEALFRDRRPAVHLAQLYQSHGEPAFVYWDPTAPRFARERVVDVITGEERERFGPEVDPVTKEPVRGMWRVEHAVPTPSEVDLVKRGKALSLTPGVKVPADPRKDLLLVFPVPEVAPEETAEHFGSMTRPTLLDATFDAEFGGIVAAGAEPMAPCDCVTLPSGNQMCTRKGVRGILTAQQVHTMCSEIREAEDGRRERVRILTEAQAVCGELMRDLPKGPERLARRLECLSQVLSERGVQI